VTGTFIMLIVIESQFQKFENIKVLNSVEFTVHITTVSKKKFSYNIIFLCVSATK